MARPVTQSRALPAVLAAAVGLAGVVVTASTARLGGPVATTLEDFFQPGSQPTGKGGVVYSGFRTSAICTQCHLEDETGDLVIFAPWQGSMMAQSGRDPLFYACLTIANQDADFAGDLCIRCHSPGGWLSGRSEPSDGSALTQLDRDGVSCSVCHRMVDPVYKPEVSPPADAGILAVIDPLPVRPGGGNFVMDPDDFRRGPYSDPAQPNHLWLHSPFHRSPALCGTCHDVSNPLYERQADGTYALTVLDAAHPTADQHDMFPLERTYSEWLHSDFARKGVDMAGRFGGNKTVVRTCQDCHMPATEGKGCAFGGERGDLAAHEFAGGNAWAQAMVLNLFPTDELDPAYMQAGRDRSVSMLQRACTLGVSQAGNRISVRVINETGHKLPTGYPEGRRMWINVEFADDELGVIAERGAYDEVSAELTAGDTRVYEARLGMDAGVAGITGLAEGESFHFALNNRVVKDNRIPPRGYAYFDYRDVGAAPVGATYADGKYWDATTFRIPRAAHSATVNVFYQTASKEYVTFLRDENVTDDRGDVLYEQWELTGKSPPVLMATASLVIAPFASGDVNGDQLIDLADAAAFVDCMTAPGVPFGGLMCEAFDFDADLDLDLADFGELQLGFVP